MEHTTLDQPPYRTLSLANHLPRPPLHLWIATALYIALTRLIVKSAMSGRPQRFLRNRLILILTKREPITDPIEVSYVNTPSYREQVKSMSAIGHTNQKAWPPLSTVSNTMSHHIFQSGLGSTAVLHIQVPVPSPVCIFGSYLLLRVHI
jgi:hypothetical protein